MKVKDLLKLLKGVDKETKIIVSSDEELNMLFESWEIAELDNSGELVIYGLSGSIRFE